MAREIWLLRHGDAEPAGEGADAQRPLTEKGRRQAEAAGRALARLEVTFAMVLTSPRVRAADTARLACEALSLEPAMHDPLGGGFDGDDARALLAGLDDEERVLVVGHEPDFSQTVADLCGGRIDLKKGGLAAVALEGHSAEMVLLMRARELKAVAGTS